MNISTGGFDKLPVFTLLLLNSGGERKMSTLLILLMWCWLVRGSLCYSYELRPHVTFSTDSSDSGDAVVGHFASYGQSGTEPVRGTFVLADETYGCQSNSSLPTPLPKGDFIVVISLSSCSDYLQAKKAEEDGTSGVVFYYTSDSVKKSLEKEGRVGVTVVIVELDDDDLAHIDGEDKQYTHVTIVGMTYAVFQQSRTFYFIITAFCVLILLSCLWFFTSYARRCKHTLRNRRRQVGAGVRSPLCVCCWTMCIYHHVELDQSSGLTYALYWSPMVQP